MLQESLHELELGEGVTGPASPPLPVRAVAPALALHLQLQAQPAESQHAEHALPQPAAAGPAPSSAPQAAMQPAYGVPPADPERLPAEDPPAAAEPAGPVHAHSTAVPVAPSGAEAEQVAAPGGAPLQDRGGSAGSSERGEPPRWSAVAARDGPGASPGRERSSAAPWDAAAAGRGGDARGWALGEAGARQAPGYSGGLGAGPARSQADAPAKRSLAATPLAAGAHLKRPGLKLHASV